MYITVTRLRNESLQLVNLLKPAVISMYTTIIYDERHFELLDSWRSKLIRPENAAGWALLAIHEETSLTRPYEFVVTLLLKLINGEDIVIQIHYPEFVPSLIVGLFDRVTNNTIFPCHQMEFPYPFDWTFAVFLRNFIRTLPCEIIYGNVESRRRSM